MAMKDDYVHPRGDAPGIELRDYFAAKVLAVASKKHSEWEAARMAYAYADAMLEIREQGQKK